MVDARFEAGVKPSLGRLVLGVNEDVIVVTVDRRIGRWGRIFVGRTDGNMPTNAKSYKNVDSVRKGVY